MTSDYYARHLSSDEYRESRRRKAELIADICEPWIGAADRVFDFGAGTGDIRSRLESLWSRPVIGIELDRRTIERPERMMVADLLRLPVRDATVHFGIANHVYEHVADVDLFFGELGRVLRPGGRIYLTAGNRFAIVEPHYRIPTLSWWPRSVATRLLRASGRGREYTGIAFKTHGAIVASARRQGLRIRDLTDDVLTSMGARYEGRAGRLIAGAGTALPEPVREGALRLLSPQWFFLIERGGAR